MPPTPMHERIIPVLSYTCATAFAGYLALLVMAVLFASSQTALSAAAREAESRVGALETEYYAAIGALNSTDAVGAGLVTPTRVEYVAEDGTPTVTRADR